jgi:GDP/UDP-N,N'-diacetylbacillosamine 2-epimerase (hydrolysing)
LKIGVLTSSRADYGIYLPLLKALKEDGRFDVEIIAFGMHLQFNQGNTINQIKKDGFLKVHEVGNMPKDDEIIDIVKGYGALVMEFGDFWLNHQYDLVFALGDRWEMSAAVQSSIPFEIKIAHIHGGETTEGAIDNIYRHQITSASKIHFTAADEFSARVTEIIGTKQDVYTVGSISIENIGNLALPSWQLVKDEFEIPFDEFILVTFHPESVGAYQNFHLANVAKEALIELLESNNLLITKANSDSLGSLYNQHFADLQNEFLGKVKLVSALGKLNYFCAMKKSSLLLGNTSSGIIEAASFNKWVVNVGDRQKGRLRNENVVDVQFKKEAILEAVEKIKLLPNFKGRNKFFKPKTCENIVCSLLSKKRQLLN